VEFLGGVFEKGFKGLEPVLANGGVVAADEEAPSRGLPLVRGVGPEKQTVGAKENGWPAEGCNGVTEVVLETELDACAPTSPSKTGPEPNAILTPASDITAKQTPDSQSIESDTLQSGFPDSGARPCQPNGPVNDDHIRTFETPSQPSVTRVPGTAGQSGGNAGRPKRVVIEFSDDAQAAAVEAFLSEILDQVRRSLPASAFCALGTFSERYPLRSPCNKGVRSTVPRLPSSWLEWSSFTSKASKHRAFASKLEPLSRRPRKGGPSSSTF
jgi:hypothetical protein